MKKIVIMLVILIAITSGALQVIKFLYPLGLENHPSIKMEVNDGSVKVDWKDTGVRGTGFIISRHSLEALSRWRPDKNQKYLAIELDDISSGRKRLVTYFSAFTTVNQGKKTIIWETGHDKQGAVAVISIFLVTTVGASILTLRHVSNSS